MKPIRIFLAGIIALGLSSCLNDIDDSGFTPVKPKISFDKESVQVVVAVLLLTMSIVMTWHPVQ